MKAAAIAEPAKRAPAKKDTRAWCKGKEGREHAPAIVFCPPPWTWKTPACEWNSLWDGDAAEWECHHEEHCGRCGKTLRTSLRPEECPAYPGSQEQRAAAGAEAAAAHERWREWRAGRSRVIEGPQHYRRKREKAS